MVDEYEKSKMKRTEPTNREQEPQKKFKINKFHRRTTTVAGTN